MSGLFWAILGISSSSYHPKYNAKPIQIKSYKIKNTVLTRVKNKRPEIKDILIQGVTIFFVSLFSFKVQIGYTS